MLNLENGTKMYFFHENSNVLIRSWVGFCEIKFLTPHLLGLEQIQICANLRNQWRKRISQTAS